MGYWKRMREELDNQESFKGDILMSEDDVAGFLIIESANDDKGIALSVETIHFIGDIGTGQAVVILVDGTTHFTRTPYLTIINSLNEFGSYSEEFDLLGIQRGSILMRDKWSRSNYLGAYSYGEVAGHIKGNQEIN